MRRAKLIVLAFGITAFAASSAMASNMGFALRLNLTATPPQNLSFLSLPYTYAPTTAELLCQDLGGSGKVKETLAWIEASSTFTTHTCGSGTNNFSLSKGIAYGVRNQPGQVVDGLVVGSHDNAYSYSIAPTTTSNLTWVSIPYHLAIPDVGGTAGVVDAEDLCQSVGASLRAVMRWDSALSAYVSYACGTVFDTPFPIAVPNGYAFVNASGQTIAWQPPHY